MSTVYRVRHSLLQSLHVLKVLESPPQAIGELSRRFLAEGQLQARLVHPNILR